MMSTLGGIFQDYISMLNWTYVKRNWSPFTKHGQISQEDWGLFVEENISSCAKELSEKMKELNKEDSKVESDGSKEPCGRETQSIASLRVVHKKLDLCSLGHNRKRGGCYEGLSDGWSFAGFTSSHQGIVRVSSINIWVWLRLAHDGCWDQRT